MVMVALIGLSPARRKWSFVSFPFFVYTRVGFFGMLGS